MKNKRWIIAAFFLVFLSVYPMNSIASGMGGPGGGKHGPPPEAFSACEGKEEGDSVEFEGRRGESLKAVCQLRDGKLVAVPENMPEGRERH